MSRLTKMLEYAEAGNSERKRLLNKPSFQKTVVDTLPKEKKELLMGENIEDTTLVQEEVWNKVVEGAKRAKCVRDVFPTVNTDSYSLRVVSSGDDAYAQEIPEGGEIKIDTDNYTKKDIAIKKIGTRPLISNEVIEDSEFDIVELELQRAGAKLENKLNRDVIKKVVENLAGSYSTTAAASHIAVTDIANVISLIKDNGYIPDTMILHPDAEGHLLQDSNLLYASFAGNDTALTEGEVPTLLGLEPYSLSVTTGDSTYKWTNSPSTDEANALICDSQSLALIAMRRDITIEQYDDPIHDLVGISCTMRYGADTIQNPAGYTLHEA